MQDMISSARVAEANVSTRTAAMCLGPEAGGRFEIRDFRARSRPRTHQARATKAALASTSLRIAVRVY
jgi:hypothetical protein